MAKQVERDTKIEKQKQLALVTGARLAMIGIIAGAVAFATNIGLNAVVSPTGITDEVITNAGILGLFLAISMTTVMFIQRNRARKMTEGVGDDSKKGR